MRAASGTWCDSLDSFGTHRCFTDVPSYSPAAPPAPAQGLPARFLILGCPKTLPGDASKRVTTLFGDGHESRINPDHHIGPLLDRRLAGVAA
jgi:hypothetical protein